MAPLDTAGAATINDFRNALPESRLLFYRIHLFMPLASPTDGRFPTTSWTLLDQLRDDDIQISHRALSLLYCQYQSPLYCLIRKKGLSHHDAEDTLQDFFTKLLRLESLKETHQDKGRLRTFLATSLSRFLINRHHKVKRQESLEVSIHLDPHLERHYDKYASHESETPEMIFDREWLNRLLQAVLSRLEERYEMNGRKDLFQTLRPVLLSGGSLRHHDTQSLANFLGMTEPALRNALLRMLKSYRSLLEEEVRQTVNTDEEMKAEIKYLLRSLPSSKE